MSQFTVQLTRAAQRDLEHLTEEGRAQVVQDLRSLGEVPLGRPPRIRRLRGYAFPLYRLRSGDFRVLYRIDATFVTVMRVIDRKDLDRALRRAGLSLE